MLISIQSFWLSKQVNYISSKAREDYLSRDYFQPINGTYLDRKRSVKRRLRQKGFSCSWNILNSCYFSHPNWHMVSKFIRLPMFKKSCSLKMNKSSASAYVSSWSLISIEYSSEPWMNLNWISTVCLYCCKRCSYWRWTTSHDGLSVLGCFAGNHFCSLIIRWKQWITPYPI